MPQIGELIESDTISSRWRDETFHSQFNSLVTSLKYLEDNCVVLVRERNIASEAEMLDLLKKIVQDSRNYDEIARARLLKL
jgi:hypothetical protein